MHSITNFILDPWFIGWIGTALAFTLAEFFLGKSSNTYRSREKLHKIVYQLWHFPLVGIWLPFTGFKVFESLVGKLPNLFSFYDIDWSSNSFYFVLFSLSLLIYLDFIEYWVHRLLHKFDFLFKVHQLHHALEHMNWWSNLQFHTFEIFIYKGISIPLIWLIFGGSIPLEAWIFVGFFRFIIGNWAHSTLPSFSGPLNGLKGIINNPQVHYWHHVVTPSGKNLGVTFTFWDQCFGTYIDPDAQSSRPPLGLKGSKLDKSILKQILSPFLGPANS